MATDSPTLPPTAVLLFYHYESVSDVAAEVEWQRRSLEELAITGRLRVAPAGLNGTLTGAEEALRQYTTMVSARFAESERIDWKFSPAKSDELFDSLNVRAVDEVVSLGVPSELAPLEEAGRHVTPAAFHLLLLDYAAATSDASDAPVLLDVRNVYEHRIGRFEVPGITTLLPDVRQFADLPAWIDAHLPELQGRPVLAYCTGGVRCESASAYLRHKGAAFQDVVQLEGGIERYLELFPTGGHFRGKNLVFDKRRSVAPYTGNPAEEDIIGRCQECGGKTDDYSPQCRCARCRLLLLVCGRCAAEVAAAASGAAGGT